MTNDDANVMRAASVMAEAQVRRERVAMRALIAAAEDALARGVARPAAVTVLGCRVLLEPPVAPAEAATGPEAEAPA